MDIAELDNLNISLHFITGTMSSTRSILVINPNSTKSMTDALVPLVDELAFNEVGHCTDKQVLQRIDIHRVVDRTRLLHLAVGSKINQ